MRDGVSEKAAPREDGGDDGNVWDDDDLGCGVAYIHGIGIPDGSRAAASRTSSVSEPAGTITECEAFLDAC